jgi:hypothetical protein
MRKERAKRRGDDLRPEYDLSGLKGGGRGKYYNQTAAGPNLVLLVPDVARAFPDRLSMNRAPLVVFWLAVADSYLDIESFIVLRARVP